jgi:hypothetical protein
LKLGNHNPTLPREEKALGGWCFNAAVDQIQRILEENADIADDLRSELTAVTEQRDRLAAVLQRIRAGYGGQVASPNCCADCDYLLPIDAALQSLTPNVIGEARADSATSPQGKTF